MATLTFVTPLGLAALSYSELGLSRVHLPPQQLSDRGEPHAARWRQAADRLAGVLAGQRDDLTDLPLDWGPVPDFHRAVYRALQRIPAGVTLSYGELAARAGRPGAARAVGQAMARNPWPLVVPCHRVLRSDGGIGGWSGTGGLAFKRLLLDRESVA